MLDIKLGGWKMLGGMRNCGRWSDIGKVILPNTILGNIAFENVLSIRVLELLLTLVRWSIWGKNKWENGESRNSFV